MIDDDSQNGPRSGGEGGRPRRRKLPTREPAGRSRRIPYALLAIGLVTLALWAAMRLFDAAGQFARERQRWEAIVELARQEPVGAGSTVRFKLDPSWESSSWRRVGDDESIERSDEVGLVTVCRTRDGKLQVAILAQSWGHAGTSGWLFSEIPVRVYPPYGTHDGPSPPQQLGRQVEEHWWHVFSALE